MSGPWNLLEGPAGLLQTYTTQRLGADPRSPAIVVCHELPAATGGAETVGRSYPLLADRIAAESGRLVVTGILRGAGDSQGNFSVEGWLQDLAFLVDLATQQRPTGTWLAGFGLGGTLCLHHAATDPRARGVACVGSPADLTMTIDEAEQLLARCRTAGVVRDPGFPADVKAWVAEWERLRPLQAAGALGSRPLLVVHGADDCEVPSGSARALAGGAIRGELRIVPGAGHALRADPRVVASLMGWLERQR